MTETPIPHTSRETTRYGADALGNFHEVELAALSSVEVGSDAKGTAYCKSSKSYHNDPLEAARLSVAAYKLAQTLLKEAPADAS